MKLETLMKELKAIEDTLLDAINYLAILKAYLEDKNDLPEMPQAL